MAISKDLKVFWYNPMRAATRSCRPIQEYLGFTNLDHEYLELNKPYFDDFLVVSNIRNPYSRYVSIYNHLYGKTSGTINLFRNYVKRKIFEEIHFPSFSIYISYNLSNVFKICKRFPNIFVKVENLYEDVSNLDFIRVNLTSELEEIMKNNLLKNHYFQDYGKKPMWYEYYDEETADLVYNHLIDDFILGNYKKDSWKDGTP